MARNYEFIRDRASFGWNLFFPFLLIAGFGFLFGGREVNQYKVGLFPYHSENVTVQTAHIPEQFKTVRYVKFIGFKTAEEGLAKLRHHKIDLLLQLDSPTNAYWVDEGSPNGYVVEQMFKASLVPKGAGAVTEKREVEGTAIRYIDWLFPGILAMNMMFSALWGVGFIIVRYRKNGVLRRFKATRLSAFEYLTAQMLSRVLVLIFSLAVVWIGCHLIFSFNVYGSYLILFVIFLLGSLCLTSLGLIVAARGTSEEFTTGVINVITWPMMFLSEVWFSIEGAPHWLKLTSSIFPLTYILRAARKVINDGAGWIGVGPDLAIIALMTVLFLGIGAYLFSWEK